jgi:hypothetical protein
VATGVVVRGILLPGDHVFGVEEGAVGASADLIDDVGLEIAVDGAGDIFALAYCTTGYQSRDLRYENSSTHRSRRRRC